MKKLLIILLCLPMICFGQNGYTPDGINYQAIARDTLGVEMRNQQLDIRFTLEIYVSMLGGYFINYQEEHSVTTNNFGLFSVVLGQGVQTALSHANNISDAGWSPFSELKVEIDDGNGYIDLGNQTFQSVPFSFKAAKALTADNAIPYDELQQLSISGDTIFIVSPYQSYFSAFGNYILLPGITELQPKVDSLDLVIDSIVNSSLTYSVGDIAQGGIIFYVSQDGKNGLVAASQDQSLSNWYDAHDVISNPSNYNIDGQKFRDWRLPTKYELNEMYLNIGQGNALGLGNLGGFTTLYNYWSSTQYDSDNAWRQDFGDSSQDFGGKSVLVKVRAIRAF